MTLVGHHTVDAVVPTFALRKGRLLQDCASRRSDLRLAHLLVHMFHVLLYKFFKANVVGTQFADPVENTALTGVEKRKVLRHLQQRPNTVIIKHNRVPFVHSLDS